MLVHWNFCLLSGVPPGDLCRVHSRLGVLGEILTSAVSRATTVWRVSALFLCGPFVNGFLTCFNRVLGVATSFLSCHPAFLELLAIFLEKMPVVFS
jgi:hypothetical protein